MTIFIGLVPPFLSTLQWGTIVLNNSGDGRIFNGTFTFPINASMCYQAIAIQQGGGQNPRHPLPL